MKLQEIEEKLERQGVILFTTRELQRAAGVSPASAKFLVLRYLKKGYLVPLKKRRGLYSFRRHLPPPFLAANKLYRPSYVSLESALAFHGLIPESVHSVTSVTPKITRTFESMGLQFIFRKIKAHAFTGYGPVEHQGHTVLVAEPEKALADTLYFQFRNKETLNDRIRWKAIQRNVLRRYLQLFEDPRLLEWAHHVIR